MRTDHSAPTAAGVPTTGRVALVVGIVLVALNLRGPIVAPSVVIGTIRAELGVSAAVAGLLTSLPVLCFAVMTLPASWLIGRVGAERAVGVALVAIGLGTVLRPVGGIGVALTGTVAIGVGITVGNVAIPVVVGRDFPTRASTVLGGYTAALNIGSMITLSLTVPVAGVVGWRGALGTWTVLVVLAAVGWRLATRTLPPSSDAAVGDLARPSRPWWRRPAVWALLVGFGAQSFAYYGLTAWLPAILSALRGLDDAAAGLGASLFQIAAIVGAVGVPVIRARTGSLRAAFVVVAVCFLALPLGLLLAPAVWPLWCGLGGAAQGGGFTVVMSTVLVRSEGVADSRRVAAAVQGGGYAVGASGASVLGAVNEATAAWTVPLVIAAVALGVLAVCGTFATGRVPSAVGAG